MKDLDQASTKTFGKQASPSVVIRGLQATDASRSYHIAVDEIGPSVRVDAANDGRDATEILDPAAC